MAKKWADNRRKGFTLVELIVVLVILAILASLLVPALTGYIDKANRQKYIAECRQLVVATQTLASEAYGRGTFDFSEGSGDETGDQFLTEYGNEIFSLAELSKTETRKIVDLAFDETSTAKVAKLVYQVYEKLYVVYDATATETYEVTEDYEGTPTDAKGYESVWNSIFSNTDWNKGQSSGTMIQALKDQNNGTYPYYVLSAQELELLTGSAFAQTESTNPSSLIWYPIEVTSAPGKYIMRASDQEGGTLAYLLYYDGHYYAHLKYNPYTATQTTLVRTSISSDFNLGQLTDAPSFADYVNGTLTFDTSKKEFQFSWVCLS